MNEQKGLGAIGSPDDYRDRLASSIIDSTKVELPNKFETILGPVMDQNKIPSCVAHSIVELMKLYWFKKTGKWIDLSPRFLDILSSESWIPLDGGRVPRTVIKLASTVGCCTTALLPNDTDNLSIAQYRDKSVITQEMRDEALKYKIPGYIRVSIDFDKLREGMYFYDAVSILFAVGEEMYVPSWKPKDTVPLRTPKKVTSGHQMTGKGWDDSMNLLRNEWSTYWGNNGETTYDPIAWRPYLYEAWAIAEIPEDAVSFLKSLPSPTDFHYTWNKNLARGQFNEDIKFAQIALMILGHLKDVSADELGHYGPKTEAAVLAFQNSKKIYPTAPGSIGPKTRAALNKLFSN